MYYKFWQIFTYPNICEAVKFSTIVLMALLTFMVEAIKYLFEYSIKFSYVIVHLVHVSTPIWLGVMEFLTKCVGGLYWLIYVMFRGSSNTPAVPSSLLSNQRQLGHSQPYRSPQYRAIDYSRPRQSYSPNTSRWDKYQRRS